MKNGRPALLLLLVGTSIASAEESAPPEPSLSEDSDAIQGFRALARAFLEDDESLNGRNAVLHTEKADGSLITIDDVAKVLELADTHLQEHGYPDQASPSPSTPRRLSFQFVKGCDAVTGPQCAASVGGLARTGLSLGLSLSLLKSSGAKAAEEYRAGDAQRLEEEERLAMVEHVLFGSRRLMAISGALSLALAANVLADDVIDAVDKCAQCVIREGKDTAPACSAVDHGRILVGGDIPIQTFEAEWNKLKDQSINNCCKLCKRNAACVAITYHVKSDGARCILKYDVKGDVAVSNPDPSKRCTDGGKGKAGFKVTKGCNPQKPYDPFSAEAQPRDKGQDKGCMHSFKKFEDRSGYCVCDDGRKVFPKNCSSDRSLNGDAWPNCFAACQGESVVSSRVVSKSGLEIPDGCTLRAWKISLYDRNLGQQYRTTLPEREYHSYKCQDGEYLAQMTSLRTVHSKEPWLGLKTDLNNRRQGFYVCCSLSDLAKRLVKPKEPDKYFGNVICENVMTKPQKKDGGSSGTARQIAYLDRHDIQCYNAPYNAKPKKRVSDPNSEDFTVWKRFHVNLGNIGGDPIHLVNEYTKLGDSGCAVTDDEPSISSAQSSELDCEFSCTSSNKCTGFEYKSTDSRCTLYNEESGDIERGKTKGQCYKRVQSFPHEMGPNHTLEYINNIQLVGPRGGDKQYYSYECCRPEEWHLNELNVKCTNHKTQLENWKKSLKKIDDSYQIGAGNVWNEMEFLGKFNIQCPQSNQMLVRVKPTKGYATGRGGGSRVGDWSSFGFRYTCCSLSAKKRPKDDTDFVMEIELRKVEIEMKKEVDKLQAQIDALGLITSNMTA